MVYFNPRQTQNGLPLLILGSAKKERIFGVGTTAIKACRKGGGGGGCERDRWCGFWVWRKRERRLEEEEEKRINVGLGVIERENGGMRVTWDLHDQYTCHLLIWYTCHLLIWPDTWFVVEGYKLICNQTLSFFFFYLNGEKCHALEYFM